MTWEGVTAVVALVTLLIIIAQQLGALKRHYVAQAREETASKERIESRVGSLEQGFAQLHKQLDVHIAQTGKAIDALRTEMPNAMSNAVTRVIASMQQVQEKMHREFIDNLLRHTDTANSAASPKAPAKPRLRTTKAKR